MRDTSEEIKQVHRCSGLKLRREVLSSLDTGAG